MKVEAFQLQLIIIKSNITAVKPHRLKHNKNSFDALSCKGRCKIKCI